MISPSSFPTSAPHQHSMNMEKTKRSTGCLGSLVAMASSRIKKIIPSENAITNCVNKVLKVASHGVNKLVGNRVAVRDPLWIFKKIKKIFEKPDANSLKDVKHQIQLAIQESNVDKLYAILNKNHSPSILREPLPNGHSPLNFALLKGNETIVKTLLIASEKNRESQTANSELDNQDLCLIRDFQFQTPYDLIEVLGNEKLRELMINWMFGKKQRNFLNTLFASLGCTQEDMVKLLAKHNIKIEQLKINLEQLNLNFGELNLPSAEVEIGTICNALEKEMRNGLNHVQIVDPLAVSFSEKLLCATSLAFLGLGVVEKYIGSEYLSALSKIQFIFLVAGCISEMQATFKNAGILSIPLQFMYYFSNFVPSLRVLSTVLKATALGVSLINTTKVCMDNMFSRKLSSAKKLFVESFNFYTVFFDTFSRKATSALQTAGPSFKICQDIDQEWVKARHFLDRNPKASPTLFEILTYFREFCP